MAPAASAVVIVASMLLIGSRVALLPEGTLASGSEATDGRDLNARIDAFWAWWHTAAPRLAAEIDAGHAASLAPEISARVDAIHQGLAWETGPALKGARHHLALSAEGDAELRVLTERWVSRAPSGDGIWEFYPARQAYPGRGWDLKLPTAGGASIDFEHMKVVVQVDATREVVDVRFHHPAFASMPEGQRTRAALLVLDSVLGEDGVERWVGAIDASAESPPGGASLDSLSAAVDDLARSATGERYVLLRGTLPDGSPMIATVNLALKPVDHLLMDDHLMITIRLRRPTPAGMTMDTEAADLNRIEDELIATLGGEFVYMGRETGGGSRVLHFHVASGGPAEPRARSWAGKHPEYRMDIVASHDPEWKRLRQWQTAGTLEHPEGRRNIGPVAP